MTGAQVAQFRASVRRFIGARVKNDPLADDLTQEVFMRVLKKLSDVKDHRRVIGWVFQIARNAVIDHFRKNSGSDPTRSERRMEAFAQPEAIEREEMMLRDELAAYVRTVVNELPPAYREAILLTEYEGWSQVELAKYLGLSVSAAKSRVQRARRMIKDAIEDCCHVQFDRYGSLVGCRSKGKCQC
ncbi:MAG: RNA polymerase sigma factor SigZ [Nibricoccus sp.]